MANYDLYAGLLSGMNRGVESYFDASDKSKARKHEAGLLKATKGLVPKTDEAGNVIEGEYASDPEFVARQRKEDAYKSISDAAKEGKILEADEAGNVSFKGYSPEYIKGQQEINKARLENDPVARAIKSLTLEKLETERTPEGKIEKLSGEARSRFDNVTGGITALRDMRTAYDAKPRKSAVDNLDMANVPLRGDTPYTEAANRFDEMLGRMQSGGAIGTQELKSFQKLRPQVTDSPEIAKTKFDRMEELLSGRLKSFGIDEKSAEGMGFLRPREGLIAPKEGLVKPQEKKASVPKVGDVVDGYSYKGGDPSKPENWEMSRKAGR